MQSVLLYMDKHKKVFSNSSSSIMRRVSQSICNPYMPTACLLQNSLLLHHNCLAVGSVQCSTIACERARAHTHKRTGMDDPPHNKYTLRAFKCRDATIEWQFLLYPLQSRMLDDLEVASRVCGTSGNHVGKNSIVKRGTWTTHAITQGYSRSPIRRYIRACVRI